METKCSGSDRVAVCLCGSVSELALCRECGGSDGGNSFRGAGKYQRFAALRPVVC